MRWGDLGGSLVAFFGVRNFCLGDAPGSFTATAISAEMIPANTSRRGVWIHNLGNRDVFLGFGNPAEGGKGVDLVKSQILLLDSTLLPLDSINVITASGTATVLFQEWISL